MRYQFGKNWRSLLQYYKFVVSYFCSIVGDNNNIKKEWDFYKNKFIFGENRRGWLRWYKGRSRTIVANNNNIKKGNKFYKNNFIKVVGWN